jgi:N-sulfoglucosamine sulfohydrolase
MSSKFYLFLFLLVSLYGCSEKAHESQAARPLNVVFILTDDQSTDLSILGTPGIQTPHLDQLAGEGILMTNAFAVVPSCSPSRSSIMTGMYPHANGHWRNTITPTLEEGDEQFSRQSATVDKVGIHDYLPTLPEILQEQGYHTGITQKFHMSPPWKFPYHFRNGIQNDPAQFRQAVTDFIQEAGDKPFFMQANIAPPHRPFDSHMDRFPEMMPHPDSIQVPPYLADTPQMRQDLAKYYGSVQLADACAGAILEALKASGHYDNTLIIFTADQGAPYHRAKASPYYAGLHVPYIAVGPNIPRGKISEALISHIDIMPTILDYLDLPIPESVQGQSLKALFSGRQKAVKGRKYIFGQHNSHGPVVREHYPSRAAFDGQYYYIKNLMHEKSYELPADLREPKGWGNESYLATLAARESHPVQYRLLQELEQGRPAEELYDIQNDPGQLVNLAAEPAYQQPLAELRAALQQWRTTTSDTIDNPVNIPTRLTQK